MKLSSFRYVAPEAILSMKRNSWMSLVAIVTVAITLFLCGVFWLLVLNIDANATMLENSVEIKAFVKDGTTEEQLETLKEQIKSLSGVASVTFVSKEDGLASMTSSFGDDKRVLAALDENPLPDAYTIKALHPEDVATLTKTVAKLERIVSVRYGQDSVDNLFALLKWVRALGLGIMALLCVSAVVLIAMNIRMTVIARREEIMVMKYVGASNAFVRWPFLLEGIIIGLLGSLIALGCLYFAYGNLIGYMMKSLLFLTYVNINKVIVQVACGMLCLGVGLGALGSTVSLRRFLRV